MPAVTRPTRVFSSSPVPKRTSVAPDSPPTGRALGTLLSIRLIAPFPALPPKRVATGPRSISIRSEEHTSELQSLMRISYAVFCLKKKITNNHEYNNISNMHVNSEHHKIYYRIHYSLQD